MLKKFLFPVRKEKITHGEAESGFSKIIREDTDRLISVVSDSYLLIENQLIYDSISREFGDLQIIDKFSFSNDSYSSLSFELPFEKREVSVGDAVGAMLRVENSYDTTKALTISINAMRLVCANGMIVNDTIFQSKTKHIGDKNVEQIIGDMMSSISNKAEGSFQQTVRNFSKMKKKKLTPELKQRFVMALTELPQFFVSHVVDEINRSNPKNLWELYNCVTYVCTHKMKRDIFQTVITEDSVNKEILQLI